MVARVLILIAASIAIGACLTLLPLAFGATSDVTKVLHAPMLIIDRWLMQTQIIMNNGQKIVLYLSVNTLCWAMVFGLVGTLWLLKRHSDLRHSNGNS